MKNLAGNKEADKDILEELYLSGIPKFAQVSKGEVPYNYVGKLGRWTLRRLWYYWSASVEDDEAGMPLELAMQLHNKKSPADESEILGDVIRAGGHGGGISPDEYVSQPLYNEEFISECKSLGIKTISRKSMGISDDAREFPELNHGEIAKLCKEGKIKSQRYITCYHIDTLVGLKEFAEFVKINNII